MLGQRCSLWWSGVPLLLAVNIRLRCVFSWRHDAAFEVLRSCRLVAKVWALNCSAWRPAFCKGHSTACIPAVCLCGVSRAVVRCHCPRLMILLGLHSMQWDCCCDHR
jgi:hypothetical protein